MRSLCLILVLSAPPLAVAFTASCWKEQCWHPTALFVVNRNKNMGDNGMDGELKVPGFRRLGDTTAPERTKKFVTISHPGGSNFRGEHWKWRGAPSNRRFQETALGPGSAPEEVLPVEEETMEALLEAENRTQEESRAREGVPSTDDVNVGAMPEQKEEIQSPYRTQVSDRDAQEVQLAYARIRRLCPNIHPDLLGLIFWIRNGEITEATVAMNQLSRVLDRERIGEETTLALYRACGHKDIVRTMMGHAGNEELQQEAMQLLWKLSSRIRAKEIQFEEIGAFQKSLISVGAADCAFQAIETYKDNVLLAAYSLCVVNNLIDTYTFDELFEIGLIEKTMAAIQKFPYNASVLYVACDILYRASKAKPMADLAKLESIQALSVLARMMEHFSGKDDRIHDKAAQALQSILMIGKH